MMKIIPMNHERPGGGKITRFAIEMPWFCVWTDLCEMELTMLRGQTQELCDMLVSTAGHEIFNTYRDALRAAVMEGVEKIDERSTINLHSA